MAFWRGSVRAIPVTRLATKQQACAGVAPLGRNITGHGSSMVRLHNSARASFGPPDILKLEGLMMSYIYFGRPPRILIEALSTCLSFGPPDIFKSAGLMHVLHLFWEASS